jgi:uncharacterized protein with GYD domain
MQVGDLVRFNKRAMEMKGEFPNDMMLIVEAEDLFNGTGYTALVLNSSGLIRRQYQHRLEAISESR